MATEISIVNVSDWGSIEEAVVHAIRLIEKMCEQEKDFKEKVDIIKRKIQVSLI